MSFTLPSKQPPETPSIPAEVMPWSETMTQHAAPGQAEGVVQEGAQSQSKDRAQDLRFLSKLIRKSELSVVLHLMSSALLDHPSWLSHLIPILEDFLLSNHKDKDVGIMLDVFQDRKACDTVFVCHLMSHVWGEFQKYDIARVIQARDVCKFGDDDYYRSFQISMIVTLMKTAGSDKFGGEVKEIFGAKSQWKKWLKVKENYILRGRKTDESDKDEDTAWNIWSNAKAELEKVKALDKTSVEADDGKPIGRDRSPPR